MTTDTKKGNILIVDDEEPVRRPLRKKLVKAGYDCLEADSATKAMEQLRGNAAELTILDITMPGKSGIELLPEIKEGFPDTAVIMATAVADPSVIIDCMKGGAQDYLIKPFDLEDVVHSVDRVLRKRQLELVIRDYQTTLEGKVEEQAKHIRELFLGAIESLITALESKDEYTAGHSRRVNDFALAISQRLDMTSEETEDLHFGALLHDVGKIAVDPTIQNKPGRLTKNEYEQIMTHAHVGPRIVRAVANATIIDIIRYHHFRYDGNCVGQALVGEQIPICVRIVTLADSFDAMTSDRPYRKALSIEEAFREIQRCAGSQFDPALVYTFTKIPTSQILTIIRSHTDRNPVCSKNIREDLCVKNYYR